LSVVQLEIIAQYGCRAEPLFGVASRRLPRQRRNALNGLDRFGHDDTEGFFPSYRHEERRRLSEKCVFRFILDRTDISDLLTVDERLNFVFEITSVVVDAIAGHYEIAPALQGDLDGLVRPFDGFDTTQKHQRRLVRAASYEIVAAYIDTVVNSVPLSGYWVFVHGRRASGETQRLPCEPGCVTNAGPRYRALVALNLDESSLRQNREECGQSPKAVDDIELVAMSPQPGSDLKELSSPVQSPGVRRRPIRNQSSLRTAFRMSE